MKRCFQLINLLLIIIDSFIYYDVVNLFKIFIYFLLKKEI